MFTISEIFFRKLKENHNELLRVAETILKLEVDDKTLLIYVDKPIDEVTESFIKMFRQVPVFEGPAKYKEHNISLNNIVQTLLNLAGDDLDKVFKATFKEYYLQSLSDEDFYNLLSLKHSTI